MNEQLRDKRILEHICEYCGQIDETVKRFGNNRELFLQDTVYHNAVSLCILQIGELTGLLSDEFRTTHTEIPWRSIKLMRNVVAHRYGTVDHGITWDVVINDIPVLASFCKKELEGTSRENNPLI